MDSVFGSFSATTFDSCNNSLLRLRRNVGGKDEDSFGSIEPWNMYPSNLISESIDS